MAQYEVQGGTGTVFSAAAPALSVARFRNGPDENQAAEKLPMPRAF